MKSKCKMVLHMLLLILGSALLGTVLLSLCFLLPVSNARVAESQAVFDSEGWYPDVLQSGSGNSFESFLPGVLDNSSDYIMFTTATDVEGEGNPLVKALRMHSTYSGDYSYYWHGYVLLLRPLFLLLNYGEIRLLNGLCQILLMVLLGIAIHRRKGKEGVLVVLTGYALLMPPALFFSLQYSWVFYIAYGTALLLLENRGKLQRGSRFLYVFLAAGLLTAFLDLLTYPLFTWGFPILIWIYTSGEEKRRTHLQNVVCSGLSWILGYAGMWSLKWILAEFLPEGGVLRSAIREATLRTGAEDGATGSMILQALGNNWRPYSHKIFLLILLAWLAFFVIRMVRGGLISDNRYPALLLTGVSPIVWYAVLSEHTRYHHLFTYRMFQIAILAGIMIFLLTVGKPGKRTGVAALRILGVVLLSGFALFSLLLGREKISSFNGSGTAERLELKPGEWVECSFSPEHPYLSNVQFELESRGEEGTLLITLSEESGKVLRSVALPLSRFHNLAMYSVEVDKALDPSKEYLLRLQVEGPGEVLALTMLYPAPGTDTEMSKGSVICGETNLDKHPIIRFNYEVPTVPRGREAFFYWFSAMFVCLVLLPGIACVARNGLQIRKEE